MKYLFIQILLLLCLVDSYSQSSKIYFELDTIKRRSTIVFTNGKKMELENCYPSVSPDSEKVAVLFWARDYGRKNQMTIYDSIGSPGKTFTVEGLSYVALANDYRFAIYGSHQTINIVKHDHICFFYDSSGIKQSLTFDSLGLAVKCKFSQFGDFILVTSKSIQDDVKFDKFFIYFINSRFTIEKINEIDAHTKDKDIYNYIRQLKIDDGKKEVALDILSIQYGKKNKPRTIMSYKYNLQGDFISLKKTKIKGKWSKYPIELQ